EPPPPTLTCARPRPPPHTPHHSTSSPAHPLPTPHLHSLSLHDALPISPAPARNGDYAQQHAHIAEGNAGQGCFEEREGSGGQGRSEEHTSELQSLAYLVCRLLLEKKNVGVRCGPEDLGAPIGARVVHYR